MTPENDPYFMCENTQMPILKPEPEEREEGFVFLCSTGANPEQKDLNPKFAPLSYEP